MWLFRSELRRGQGLAEGYEEAPLTGLGRQPCPSNHDQIAAPTPRLPEVPGPVTQVQLARAPPSHPAEVQDTCETTAGAGGPVGMDTSASPAPSSSLSPS